MTRDGREQALGLRLRKRRDGSRLARGRVGGQDDVAGNELPLHRSVERALIYEIERQTNVLSEGGSLQQETRGWDEDKGVTLGQRSKEFAHDYRYFPDPDLPPLAIDEPWVEERRTELPELPDARRQRFEAEYSLSTQDALLLTSANAVRCGGEQIASLRGLRVHAVGKATAEAAREAGFDVASSGDAGVDRLLGSLEPDLRLLHLCGEDRRAPRDARQAITPVIVYRAKEIAADLGDASGGVALIHSPRAGARFAALIDEAGVARPSVAIAAISSAAAEAAGEGWDAIEIAATCDDEALLALAERLCNKPDRQ